MSRRDTAPFPFHADIGALAEGTGDRTGSAECLDNVLVGHVLPQLGQFVRGGQGQYGLGRKKADVPLSLGMPGRKRDPDKVRKHAAIGERVKALRDLCDVTQEVMADRLQCDQSAYSKYETGERRIPVEIALRLCARTGSSLGFIYAGTMVGVEPELASLLRVLRPGLARETPAGMDRDTDTALASYRAATRLSGA